MTDSSNEERRGQGRGPRSDGSRPKGPRRNSGGRKPSGSSSNGRGPKRDERSSSGRPPRRDSGKSYGLKSRGDDEKSRDDKRKGGAKRFDGPRKPHDEKSDEKRGLKGGRSRGEKREARKDRPTGGKRFDKKPLKRKDDEKRKEENKVTEASEKKSSWTPKRERTVKSKKEYDRERMERLVEGTTTIYRGELDPRKKEEEEEKRKTQKAEEAEKQAEADDRYSRNDAASDFRDRFERCEASPARLAALYVTREVRRREAYAQQIIEREIDNSNMSAVDRAFATLLVLGVVSTQGTLDDIINRALANPRDIKPDVRDPLRISTYEIILLGKAPHAAVDQGVELVKAVVPSASRLANAVLHRVLAMKDEFPFGDPTHDIGALARSYAFPEWMARMLVKDMGAKEASNLMKVSNDPAPLFIAVNALKASDAEVEAVFAETGVTLEQGEAGGIQPAGCYRVANPRILADGRVRRLISQGKILVSDAAAQAVASTILEDGEPESLLEVGAGRGTKTILMQSAAQRRFGHQLNMSSLDSHSFKMGLLEKRTQEYGVNVSELVTGNATRLYMALGDRTFDTIFIDAPCSGLGTLRRHHEIRWRLTNEHIDELAKTGLAMLKSAAQHVSDGGQIVYSTCTVTYAENNGVVKRFLESEEGQSFELAPIAGKACFVSQLSPDSCDAHFAVRFRKCR